MHTLHTLFQPELLPPQRQGGPLLHPIKVLHRHDGYISFAVSEGKSCLDDTRRFRPSFAIRASALDSMFPDYVERLTKNSFVSINAAYTLARHDRTSLVGHPQHRKDTLKYLCACYCDVDHYKVGLSFHEARSRVMDMFEAGELPWASMIVNSGRGMWLLWLLHDYANPSQAHHGAYDTGGEFDHLMIYSKVNLAIVNKLRDIGSDPQATDGARYIRTPGSFRTDSESAVWWSIQGTGEAGFSYTLWELADILGVKCRRTLPVEREAEKQQRKMPGRAVGQIVSNGDRLTAVRTIIALRGGRVECGSQPHILAYVYAVCLRYCKVTMSEAFTAVRSMGADCTPKICPSACDAAVRSGYAKGQQRLQKATIARCLHVTKEEAEVIAQRIGKPFPCADGALIALTALDGSPKKPDLAATRRQEIRRIIAERGNVPTVRKMEALLKNRGFDTGSYVSISADYKILGIETPRMKRLREGEAGRQLQSSFPMPLQAAA